MKHIIFSGRRFPVVDSAILAVAIAAASAPVCGQERDLVRGMYLYENHCTECHTSVVHVQKEPKATNLEEIEAFIRRWVEYKELPWSEDEILDVRAHLNALYYKY